jgi:Flp pilus assembly protein TadD
MVNSITNRTLEAGDIAALGFVWRRIMRSVLFCCLVAAGLATGCRQAAVGELLGEAHQLAIKGDPASWDLALIKVETLINRGEKDARVMNFYTMCLERTGRGGAALLAAKSAATVYPTNYTALLNYGSLLSRQGSYQDALPVLLQATQQQPDAIESLRLLAFSAARADSPEAGRYYEALCLLPGQAQQPEHLNEWGLWLHRQGKSVEAINMLVKGSHLPDAPPTIYYNLAVVYEECKVLPRNARVEMARRNYILYKINAPDMTADRSRAVQQRLRVLSTNS